MENFELENLLSDFIEKVNKIGFELNERDIEYDLWKGSNFGIQSNVLGIENLPNKIWVYRNYNGGGMSGKINRSEIHHTSKQESKKLEKFIDICEATLLQMETLCYGEKTEYGIDTHTGWLLVNY